MLDRPVNGRSGVDPLTVVQGVLKPARRELVFTRLIPARRIGAELDAAVPHRIGFKGRLPRGRQRQRRQTRIRLAGHAMFHALHTRIEIDVLDRGCIRFAERQQRLDAQRQRTIVADPRRTPTHHHCTARTRHQQLALDAQLSKQPDRARPRHQLKAVDRLMPQRREKSFVARHGQGQAAPGAMHRFVKA